MSQTFRNKLEHNFKITDPKKQRNLFRGLKDQIKSLNLKPYQNKNENDYPKVITPSLISFTSKTVKNTINSNTNSPKSLGRNFGSSLDKIKLFLFNSQIPKQKKMIKTETNFYKNKTIINNFKKDISVRNIRKKTTVIKINSPETTTIDYSIIMKHLDKWDKDHCNFKKGESLLLYNTLINYYKTNHLTNEEKNISTMDGMLKSKSKFQQLLFSGYLSHNKSLVRLLFKPHNKSISRFKTDKKDDEKNLSNNSFNNNFIDNSNIIHSNEKDDDDFYSNKILKQKVKYERELYRQLLFVNNILFNKQLIKNQKKNELEKIYESRKKLKEEYDNKFKDNLKLYWLRYDEFSHNMKKILPISIEQKRKKKSSLPVHSSHISNQIKNIEKNMQSIKNSQIYSMSNEMMKFQKAMSKECTEKISVLNNKKKILESELKILNNELGYYKQVNDELLREHRSYYMDILKKGVDLRKDGLVWVVKNLIELQVNLEYQHFPKYLTHEQIDYLKFLACLILEEAELKIIISVLKKRQSNERINDNIKTMNLVDEMMTVDRITSKENYNVDNYLITKTKKEIDKKFLKIYQKNENVVKERLEKNQEEIKINKILIQIKKGLYSDGNNNFIKKNEKSILEAFIGKTKNKDQFNLILSIRNRLIELEKFKKQLIQKEKDIYLERMKFIANNTHFVENLSNKELIKRALFGINFDLI